MEHDNLNLEETDNDSILVIPTLYHCKSCGFVSTKRNGFKNFKGILICIECKEDYEKGVENVRRWITSASNGC